MNFDDSSREVITGGRLRGLTLTSETLAQAGKGTKFYRVNDEYIITNCPPLIEVE